MQTETMKNMINIHFNVDPNFKAPPPDPEEMSKCRFLLVRHAVTEFNLEFARVGKSHGLDGEEYR
jgi:hypothetical protein